MTDKTPLAQTLGEHYSALDLKRVPGDVVEKARLVVLDVLASAISGWDTDFSRSTRQFGATSANPDGSSTMWADGIRATPLDAIFVNTTLVHSLLRDDSLPGTSTHGGSIIIPTALALAEASRVPGERVLLAAVSAYDVQGRLGSLYEVSGRVTRRGYRGTPVFGPFSGATAGSVVLGLDAKRFAAALNLAGNFSGGLLESMSYGTPEYRVQTANAARSGALAALLAEHGTEVAPTTMDGEYGFFKVFADVDEVPEYVTSELGERYEILRVLHKPYPTCGNNIRAVRTFERAVARFNIDPSHIEHVRLRVNPHSKDYPGCDFQGPFESVDQALLSTQFAVSAVLQHGRLTRSVYEKLDDPEIADLARKVELLSDPSVDVGLLDCRAQVTLRDGTTLEANATGQDDNMFQLSREAAVASFHELTEDVLTEEHRDRIIDLTLRLDELDSVDELVGLLRVSH